MNEKKYDWKYVTVGGVTRVNIERGEDIAHLAELDRKQWTVLSCPVKDLEFDERTLSLIDADGDGHIHVDEVIAASQWITSVLKDTDILLQSPSSVSLDVFADNDEGNALRKSARQILDNLGKADADTIDIADTSDSVAIFAKTRFNGDGIITAASTDDEALKALVGQIVAAVGSVTDRSGEPGVDTDHVEQFYAALADYSAWQADGKADGVLPFGADTEAALAAVEAVNEKIADWFMRCKLTAFATDHAASLDVTTAQIDALSAGNLSTVGDEVASLPLAHVTADGILSFAGINPAWQGAFNTLKAVVIDKVYPGAESLTEAQWQTIPCMFDAYKAWKGARKGEAVESMGIETVDAVLAAAQKDVLLDLIAQDKALEAEAAAIDTVDKFAHYCRDFYTLLRNYVSMSDFYASATSDIRAIFQAGRLFIDQRSTDLCIRVTDMGKHGGMAGLSGMYIVYCTCTSKAKPAPMTIAAVLTDGDVDNLRPGTNAIFYDRDGLDWDAVVTSIVDNPISVRQAFWRPYKKLARWISDKIDKSAAAKEDASTSGLLAKADTVKVPATKEEAAAAGEAAKKPPFDIAKFAGIFAAIGMAVGMLGAALASLAKGILAKWWYTPVILLILILVISGPSMFIAWRKLRKRNLAPVLNANGWAINSNILVNTRFGAALTSLAKYPKKVGADPFVKRAPVWLRILRTLLLVAVLAFLVLWFTNTLAPYNLKSPFQKKVPQTEQVEEPVVAESIEAPEAAADIPAADAAPAADVAQTE